MKLATALACTWGDARLACGAALCGLIAGCSSPNSTVARQQLRSDYPPTVAAAIVEVAETQDRQAIHQLVALLDSDDPAIRLYAAEALRRMTGQTMDYRYYDDPLKRKAAVDRWQAAIRDGRVVLVQPGVAGQPGSADPPK